MTASLFHCFTMVIPECSLEWQSPIHPTKSLSQNGIMEANELADGC